MKLRGTKSVRGVKADMGSMDSPGQNLWPHGPNSEEIVLGLPAFELWKTLFHVFSLVVLSARDRHHWG
jgi:hypothetical protein